MITRREFFIAALSVLTTLSVVTLAQTTSKPVMHSRVFPWSEMPVAQTKVGERRAAFDSPTATLENLECHVTTLNPGEAPHAAHKHPDEELMFVKEGVLEAVQNGVTNRVEAGGIIFCASNEMHGLRNVGTNRATYFVLKIYPHDLPQTAAK